MELIIKNGWVVDGTGNPAEKADIGIADGRIAAMEPHLTAHGSQTVIDAGNCIVCPGFIDVHSHDDLYLLKYPECDEKVLQGVTTTIGGNCGISPAPMSLEYREEHEEYTRVLGLEHLPRDRQCFETFDAFLNAVEAVRPGINYAALAGHGSIRLAVMGMSNADPDRDRIERMKALLSEAMQAGALGLSTGLIYAPGSYAGTDELIELTRHAAAMGGMYASHIRNEGTGVVESVKEAIHIGEASNAPVHISHHKIANRQAWSQSRETLKLMDEARDRGMTVTGDQYPYNASATTLTTILPDHFLAVGMETLRRQLKDPDFRQKVRREILNDPADRWKSLLDGNKRYGITVSHSVAHPEYTGKSLTDIGSSRNRDPYDVVMDLISEEGTSTIMTIFNQVEEDIENIMRDPHIMVGSDGVPGFGGAVPHPRMTGAFPRVLGRYVHRKSVISLEEAIRKMTFLSARTFGLANKGLIRPGFDADLVIFDPDEIIDNSTYECPASPPGGIKHVIVGGRPAVSRGVITGQARGRVLRGRRKR